MNESEFFEPPVSGVQSHPKLIGYGLYSLVFRPPFLLKKRNDLSGATSTLRENPFGFIGLITTTDHYENRIKKATALLKELSSKIVRFSDLLVFPVPFSPIADFEMLENAEIQFLVEQYHTVRKKVEYEGTWKGKDLVQLIYPYAGQPLEQFCKKPRIAPSWTEFFQSISEVGRFLIDFHNQGYVHGDLSPNNLLYKDAKITVVDWNIMSAAESFLQQRKGRSRIGCWSPEHFCLTTTRVKNLDADHHWLIYAEEMQKYLVRLLDFNFSVKSSARAGVREYFRPYSSQNHPMYRPMYTDLKILSSQNPAAIGKYHDLRYFMDTIAKCVSAIFPNRTEAQQNCYNPLVALSLVQNLPERKFYLEDPEMLAKRLLFILQACEEAGKSTLKAPAPLEREQIILNLLH